MDQISEFIFKKFPFTMNFFLKVDQYDARNSTKIDQILSINMEVWRWSNISVERESFPQEKYRKSDSLTVESGADINSLAGRFSAMI